MKTHQTQAENQVQDIETLEKRNYNKTLQKIKFQSPQDE